MGEMMEFTKSLNNKLDELHLLNHPFYQSWNTGSLSLQALQTYAKEYYHHVAAFPRYISGIHFLCPDLKMRQVLLGNLIEEEQGDENHPELWKRFAEGLGITRSDLLEDAQVKETQELVEVTLILYDQVLQQVLEPCTLMNVKLQRFLSLKLKV